MASPPPTALVDAPRPRRLNDWIEGYVRYTEDRRSPEIFRRWAAIAAVAATLERKVWTRTFADVYPNLYVFLVGPAGSGKGVSYTPVVKMIEQWEFNRIAPTRVSIQSLMDALAKSHHRIVIPRQKDFVEYHSLKIFVPELSVFFHTYENQFAANLTDIWDGTQKYEEHKRTNGKQLTIVNPILNILACDTPQHLQRLLPDGAWTEGLMSRVIMVYSEAPQKKRSMFEKLENNVELEQDVAHDLRQIDMLCGPMEMTPEAQMAFDKWDLEDGQAPKPTHPKLESYCERRPHQLVKLSMIASASRGASMKITEDDFYLALSWLVEIEENLPLAFTRMAYSQDRATMDETLFFVIRQFGKTNAPIPRHAILSFLSGRAPHNAVNRILELMETSNMLLPSSVGNLKFYVPNPTYRPSV